MIITDLQRDFFKQIASHHVLVLVNTDVDGLCTCKILTYIFKSANVTYTVKPVTEKGELEAAVWNATTSGVKWIVLINCGANFNASDELKPDDEAVIFIIDSHRPIHLDNIYDSKQIRVIINLAEKKSLDYPAYTEIYQTEEDDEDGEENEENEESESLESLPKRRRLNLEERAEKIARERQWMATRRDKLWDYYQDAYYSYASSLLLLEMGKLLSRTTGEMIWWGIVGVSSQLLEGKMNMDEYLSETLGDLRNHVSRYDHQVRDTKNALRIQHEDELFLILYKHWTLEESLTHSLNTASVFQPWMGTNKVKTFFADLEVTLKDAKGNYSNMPRAVRDSLRKRFKKKAPKYKIDDVLYHSYSLTQGFRDKSLALDVACAVAGLNEIGETFTFSSVENFAHSLDSLSLSNSKAANGGIRLYKRFLGIVKEEAVSALMQNRVVTQGPFLCYVFRTTGCDLRYFRQPHGAMTFGRFLLRAYNALTIVNSSITLQQEILQSCDIAHSKALKWSGWMVSAEFGTTTHKRRGKTEVDLKPMVLEIPLPDEEWYLIVGIAPVAQELEENRPSSLLPTAFEKALKSARCTYETNFFDPSMLKLRSQDRGKFMDSLATILAD